MTKALDEFNQEVEQKKGRITELENSINDDITALSYKEQEYKEAVANDTDNIDDLFHDIEQLQSRIKADKHKLNTLRTVTNEQLKKSAINVLQGFNSDVDIMYREKLADVDIRLKQVKADYIKKAIELKQEVIGINKERNELMRKYGHVMKSNNLSKQEVNQIDNGLYLKLDDATYGAFSNLNTQPITITDVEVKINE